MILKKLSKPEEKEIYTAIGLMSGTSADGIDLALIESDGKNTIKNKKFTYSPYPKDFKERLLSIIGGKKPRQEIQAIEKEFTLLNVKIVKEFLQNHKINPNKIDAIAFHGHTILHNPEQKVTWQIGDAELLESEIKIKVIKNFRTFDVANGGQGAPLVPIYHFHMLGDIKKPVAVLNLGGISNITYIPSESEEEIEAFDVCFANAPIDDLVKEKTGADFDTDGKLAKQGRVNHDLAKMVLQDEIFHKKPPKSFDRDDFTEVLTPIKSLELKDALATLAYMHAWALKINLNLLPKKVKTIFVCGGGSKNTAIIAQMREALKGIEIKSVEELKMNGDAIEAEAFAFLAIRVLKKLPISFQKTTGISPGIDYAQAFSQQDFSFCGDASDRA